MSVGNIALRVMRYHQRRSLCASSSSKFERRKDNQYSKDTIAFFANPWRKQLSDPISIVIVAEDANFLEEDQSPLVGGMEESRANPDRRVVGFCSWDLESGSARKGQFSSPDAQSDEHSLSQNVDKPHMSLVDEIKYKGGKCYVFSKRALPSAIELVAQRCRGHTNVESQGISRG